MHEPLPVTAVLQPTTCVVERQQQYSMYKVPFVLPACVEQKQQLSVELAVCQVYTVDLIIRQPTGFYLNQTWVLKLVQFLLVPAHNECLHSSNRGLSRCCLRLCSPPTLCYKLSLPCSICSYTLVSAPKLVYRCGLCKHVCGFVPFSVAVVFLWYVRASCCVGSTAYQLF